MFSGTYYAKTYAGITGRGLYVNVNLYFTNFMHFNIVKCIMKVRAVVNQLVSFDSDANPYKQYMNEPRSIMLLFT